MMSLLKSSHGQILYFIHTSTFTYKKIGNSILIQFIKLLNEWNSRHKAAPSSDHEWFKMDFSCDFDFNKPNTNHLLFLRSDDIIRLLEQNGRLLNKLAILFWRNHQKLEKLVINLIVSIFNFEIFRSITCYSNFWWFCKI